MKGSISTSWLRNYFTLTSQPLEGRKVFVFYPWPPPSQLAHICKSSGSRAATAEMTLVLCIPEPDSTGTGPEQLPWPWSPEVLNSFKEMEVLCKDTWREVPTNQQLQLLQFRLQLHDVSIGQMHTRSLPSSKHSASNSKADPPETNSRFPW